MPLKRKTKPKPPPSQLAIDSYNEFSKYLSRYQWAAGAPYCCPKASELFHAIQNRGIKGGSTILRSEGYKIVVRQLQPWVFDQALRTRLPLYYTSWGRTALIYLDIDLHRSWQTAEVGQTAKHIIQHAFTRFFHSDSIFWANSARGMNGYVKVDISDFKYQDANKVFARLQHSIRLILAQYQNLADFEVKGTISHVDAKEFHWGSFGKLPIHSPDWSAERLDEFKSKRMVSATKLKQFCDCVETAIPEQVLTDWNAHKARLGNAPEVRGDYFLVGRDMQAELLEKYGEGWSFCFSMAKGGGDSTWLHLDYLRDGKVFTEWELQQEKEKEEHERRQERLAAAAHLRAVASHTTGFVGEKQREGQGVCQESVGPGNRDDDRSLWSNVHGGIDVSDLVGEPDSFKRQRSALLRLARFLKRVPSLQEGLEFIKAESLFTGTWEEHSDRREDRVRSALKYISQTFDPKKCSTGSVQIGKYDDFAKKNFPNGIVGGRSVSYGPDGTPIPVQQVQVSHEFISVAMSVCEYALITNPNPDETLPHNRARDLWKSIASLVPEKFCARKWAVCREVMDKRQIVKIINRKYRPGKAMTWAVGQFFPGQGRWRRKKATKKVKSNASSTRFSVRDYRKVLESASLVQEGVRRTRSCHNTWLCKQPPKTSLMTPQTSATSQFVLSRAPP